MLDKLLGSYIGKQGVKFVVLDVEDIKKCCEYLGIKYKPFNTYFCIDTEMCSFSKVP